MSPSFAVRCDTHDLGAQASALAARLGVPVLAGPATRVEHLAFLLEVTPAGLQLAIPHEKGMKPLRVDFSAGRVGHRLAAGSGELLTRAVGVRRGRCPDVLDATGGLGRDAFVMARAGCRVTVCERNPVIHALLEDGLRRACGVVHLGPALERLSLQLRDANELLAAVATRPEVIYLDPMFPERGKSAAVRKEQRVLQKLAGPDADAAVLAKCAKNRARSRVVVKRPRQALPLLPAPDVVFSGKKVRFDVYLAGGVS